MHSPRLTVQPTGQITVVSFRLARQKFLEEARVLAQFHHRGIVGVYSTFEENNTAYMVMEFIKGKTLLSLVEARGPLPEKEVVNYITQAADALDAVHEAKLLHRDIKPDNLMVTHDGRVVLVDFGTARAFASGKTRCMTAMLTPGYAPLEQYGQQARFGCSPTCMPWAQRATTSLPARCRCRRPTARLAWSCNRRIA